MTQRMKYLLEHSLIAFKNKIAKKTLLAKSISIKNNLMLRIIKKRDQVKGLKADLILNILKEAKKKTLTQKYKPTFVTILNNLM